MTCESMDVDMECLDEIVLDPSSCSTVVCPATEALYVRLMFCMRKYEMLDFDQECITAIYEGLQECIKAVARIMSSERHLLAYGKNLISEKNRALKPVNPREHCAMKKEFSLEYFNEIMKMHGQSIGNPTIYYRFLERIKYKLNDKSFRVR